jgi:hypothetical protein
MMAFDVENKMDMWFISEQQPEVVGRALRASVHIAVFHHVIWLGRCDKRLTSHESMRSVSQEHKMYPPSVQHLAALTDMTLRGGAPSRSDLTVIPRLLALANWRSPARARLIPKNIPHTAPVTHPRPPPPTALPRAGPFTLEIASPRHTAGQTHWEPGDGGLWRTRPNRAPEAEAVADLGASPIFSDNSSNGD